MGHCITIAAIGEAESKRAPRARADNSVVHSAVQVNKYGVHSKRIRRRFSTCVKDRAVLVVLHDTALNRNAEHIATRVCGLASINVVLANLSDTELRELDGEVYRGEIRARHTVRQSTESDLACRTRGEFKIPIT